MSKSKRNVFYIVIFLVTVITAILVIIQINKYVDSQNNRRIYFLSNVYYSLNDCADTLIRCNDWRNALQSPDGDPNSFDRAVKEMNKLDTLFCDGQFLVDNKINYSTVGGFSDMAKYITEGVKYNEKFICNSFLADGKISDNEAAYLTEMGSLFKQAAVSMVDSKRNIKPLSAEQINKVFAPVFSRYSFQNFTTGLRN